MNIPVPRRTAGAKLALKAFGIAVAVGVVVVVLLLVAKYALHINSAATSVVRVLAGWLVLFALIGALVSGIVVLVQRSSRTAPSSTPLPRQDRAPGWYPDQLDPKLQRYFDGRNWTSGTAPRE
jgi:hypothetical protein